MYSEKIMEEFLNPKNYGTMKGASGVGKVVSDMGSEIIKIFIKVENEKIVDCQFQTFGGVVAIALSSFVTTLLIGNTIEKVKKLEIKNLTDISGKIPEQKEYLAGMVLGAAFKAINSYENKTEID